ncbi:MAG: hypothetical protein AB8I58_24125, partial [Anaerolineales bacterium]
MSPAPEEARQQTDTDKIKDKTPRLPSLFAYAKGHKDGNEKAVGVTVLAGASGGMGGATGIPMAVGLKLLHSGKITRHGVFAPEMV